MTEVKVTGKYINVLPIQDLIVRQESLVDDIWFLVDNYVDGLDFSGWTWRIYYKTALDDGYTTLLESIYDSENRSFRIHWVPDKNITRRSGWLTIQLRASKDTDEGMLKWNTAVASVNIGRALQADSECSHEGIMEEYLDRMESLAESSMSDYHAVSSALEDEVNRAKGVEADLQEQIDHINIKDLDVTKIKLNLATSFERGDSGMYDTLCIGLATEFPAGDPPVFPAYIDVVTDVKPQR